MNKKNNILIIGLISFVVILLMAIAKGSGFKLSSTFLGQNLQFETLRDGVKFKSPVGADVTVNVASSDMVAVTDVKQDGKDTIIRLSPVAKK